MTVLLGDDTLRCHCGRVCVDLRGLRAHQRSHESVICPECGTTVGALGIGAHRRHAHGIEGSWHSRRTQTRPTQRPTIKSRRDQLERLLPGAAPVLLNRLARWIVRVDPNPDLWVVIGVTDGPHLTSRVKVGMVAAEFREPALVFPLAWLDEFQPKEAA